MTSDSLTRPTPTAQFRKKTSIDWEADASIHAGSAATSDALPMGAIAPTSFSAALHEQGDTRIIPFDLSQELGIAYPATTPGLLAGFLHICPGETLSTQASATSQMFFVIRGSGKSTGSFAAVDWAAGDLFVVPMNAELDHVASADSALYWVSDEPLLSYLGVQPGVPRFRPTMFRRESLLSEIDSVRRQPAAASHTPTGVLLGNRAAPGSRSLTHTLWSSMQVLPAGATHSAHRHNGAALDLCVEAAAGTYTLIGERLLANGAIDQPVRQDLTSGSVIITPPGLWRSLHNESGSDAVVLAVQDAGLQTYLRTLDSHHAG